MKGDAVMRLRLWLFWLSIALNVFFIGTYMAVRLPWSTEGKARPELVMPYETLGLSPQQRAVFEAERGRFHSQLTETQQAIHSKQAELIHLLSMGKPDRAAIYAKQQEILNLQGDLQRRVISHLLEVSAPLSQKQRDNFFALLKQRMARQRSGYPVGCY